MSEDPAVTNFRDYIRINTVQPNPDYDSAMVFLAKMAKELDLPYKITEVAEKRPVFLMTWKGQDPSLPSILLNSHVDVVPVFADKWKYGPFEAFKDEKGDIYGRGTQDMKCVGIQYIEAIRKLKQQQFTPLRTIHLTFVPDEEIGGLLGMAIYVKTAEFKELNVGFALDEGLASPDEYFSVYYGERCPWWLKVTATGVPGHGLQLMDNTAAEKLVKVINKFMELRATEKKKLADNPEFSLGDVTSVNMTVLSGGVQPNVVPNELSAVFDIRVTPKYNIEEMKKTVLSWVEEAGSGMKYEFLQEWYCTNMTETEVSNPWWNAFYGASQSLNLKIKKLIFPGATDSRYVRQLGIPAIGFSPMNHTPVLLHDHDEFLNEKIYLEGINIYCKILTNLANVPKF